jgi:hypothetical protein
VQPPEIPGYRLEQLAGKTERTQTYFGRDAQDGRVIVKCYRPKSADDLVAFVSRASAVASLRHANLAGLRERGKAGDFLFAVRDYFSAGSVFERIASQGDTRRLGIAVQVGRALEHAHLRGLIHGAVKPSNVFCGEGDRVILADFPLIPAPSRAELSAPEQATSASSDARSDQYALAGLTRALLAAAPACAATADLERALDRSLSPEPEARFRRIDELVNEIESAISKLDEEHGGSAADVKVELVDRTLRVQVDGTWTPGSVQACERDIERAMRDHDPVAIGYVLRAHGGCTSMAIERLTELHKQHRQQLKRVAFVSETPQARGASVLIGTRVSGLDWKTFSSVEFMDAWLREVQ